MATLILTIIIVYFLWLVVKPLMARYARRKFQEHVNDMFRRAYGEAFGSGDTSSDGARYGTGRDSRQAPQKRRKIFGADEGEYIEFEETTFSADYVSTETSGQVDPSTRSHTPREPQVSDAEWEEI